MVVRCGPACRWWCAAGYKSITIHPHTGGDFEYMKAATQTPYGDVAAGWKAEGNNLKSLNVEIPFNTTATVKVPAPSKDAVTCSAGVAAVDYKDGCAIFNVGSGQYTFTVK